MVYKDQIGLVEWCRQKQAIGAGYVYGTYFGQIITEELIQAKARQYPVQYTTSYIERSRKWIGKEAGDCVGLIKGYYWYDPARGKVVYRLDERADTSANGMRSAARNMNGKTAAQNKGITWGYISTIPEKAGVLVWKDGHIGVYVGNGLVIESRGVDYGVVETKLSGRPWLEWCVCPFISYEGSNMIICQRQTGFDENAKAMHYGLAKLGYTLGDVSLYGQYGSRTSAAVAQFQADNGLPVNGDVFDDRCNRAMIMKLVDKATGITQSMLDSEVMRANIAESEVVRVTGIVDNLTLNINEKDAEIDGLKGQMGVVAIALDTIEAFRQSH